MPTACLIQIVPPGEPPDEDRDLGPLEPGSAALLPAVLAADYLTRIERAGFDPFDPRIGRGRVRRLFRLWRAAARGNLG